LFSGAIVKKLTFSAFLANFFPNELDRLSKVPKDCNIDLILKTQTSGIELLLIMYSLFSMQIHERK
jgi:hypothetical protein